MVKLTFCNPSRRLIEAVKKIVGVSGVEVKTEKVNGIQCLVLEVSGIENGEFEWTIGRTLEEPAYERDDLARIVEAVRWIDPILTEFKLKAEVSSPDDIFIFTTSPVDGSCNAAGEITIDIGDKDSLGSKEEVEFAFIEELIHHIQFQIGGDPYENITEGREEMVKLAYEYIPNSWIPKRYEKLRESFKP